MESKSWKEVIVEWYVFLCVGAVTAIIILMFIFGGEINVHINFNSWNQLLNHLKSNK